MVPCPKWSMCLYVSHGYPYQIHRRLHVFWLLEYSPTIMYNILLCRFEYFGYGSELAPVILYRYYHYYLLIVWTTSVLVGCVMYVWHLYRYYCTLLVMLCVYGMRFPMEHLRLLQYLVFLYSLNVDAFVHVSISMVTVPLL